MYAINYLNQFLPPRDIIQYIALDMARYTKNPKLNVISRLDSIADIVVKQTGIFLSGPHMEPSLPVRPEARCVLHLLPTRDFCMCCIASKTNYYVSSIG